MTEHAFKDDDSADDAVLPRLSVDEVQLVACMLKALADPTRLHILDVLSQAQGRMGACQLAGLVGVPNDDGQLPQQSTISHHLKVLKKVGLVRCEREQQWYYYSVCSERLKQLYAIIDMLRSSCD